MDFSIESLDLTLDEIEGIEDIVDAPASTWGDIKQGRLMKAVLLTVRRRTDPDATLDDIGAVKLSELEAELRPTKAEG